MIDDSKILAVEEKIDELFKRYDPRIFKSVESFMEKAIRKVKKSGKSEGRKVFVKVQNYYRRNELEALDAAKEIYSFIEQMNLNDSDFVRLLGNAKRILRILSNLPAPHPERELSKPQRTSGSSSFQKNLGKIIYEKYKGRF